MYEENDTISVFSETEPEKLLDAFLANEIPAFDDGETKLIMWSDYDCEDYEDYQVYSVGERTDLDNDGDGNIADEFQLSAEYWDSPDDRYDENSIFTFRDEQISMTEYEALRKEILGY